MSGYDDDRNKLTRMSNFTFSCACVVRGVCVQYNSLFVLLRYQNMAVECANAVSFEQKTSPLNVLSVCMLFWFVCAVSCVWPRFIAF